MRSYYVGDIYPAYAPYHNATNQFSPPSKCLTCSKPISLDISYHHVEADLLKSDHPTKSRFVGRVCSVLCFDFYILSRI